MTDGGGGNDVDSPEPAKCLAPQDAPSSEDLALLKTGGVPDEV
jgi:hypothetical protein